MIPAVALTMAGAAFGLMAGSVIRARRREGER